MRLGAAGCNLEYGAGPGGLTQLVSGNVIAAVEFGASGCATVIARRRQELCGETFDAITPRLRPGRFAFDIRFGAAIVAPAKKFQSRSSG